MVGSYNDQPVINKEEVESFKWMTLEAIKEDMIKNPEVYTAWFKIIFEKSYDKIASYKFNTNA